jgi:hypothetical protein
MRPSSIILILILILLLSSSSLTAQTSAATTSTVFTTPPASQSCPVNFSVKRNPKSGLVMVKRPGTPPGPAYSQGLHIDFVPRTESPIRKASITVHGMTPGTRMLPTRAATPMGDDATETFELTPSAGLPLLHSSIWTKKMSAVTYVELTRIEYADGTTWQPSPESRCTAAPSLFVLVDSAAAR